MLKKILPVLGVLALATFANPAGAVQNANVNIAYPLNGGSVNNYFTSSFSTTCPGGANTVKWGFDGTNIGSSDYYDTFSGQFLYKLPSGWHTFDVSSSCGSDSVKFFVN
jgi:hypothetical protein